MTTIQWDEPSLFELEAFDDHNALVARFKVDRDRMGILGVREDPKVPAGFIEYDGDMMICAPSTYERVRAAWDALPD